MEYKVFDWKECSAINGAHVAALYASLCNDRIDIDEFVFQFTTLKHELGRKCPPNEAKRNFKYLKEKFGFFTGEKVL